MNICIDIDGTITNAYYWVEYINKHFGYELVEEDIIYYDICKVAGITEKQFGEFYSKYSNELHEKAVIRDDAKSVIHKLAKEHSVYYVTARPEALRDVTNKWFELNGLPDGEIFMLGSHDKVERAKALNCDVFLEDRYENAVQLSEAGIQVILMDCHYNRLELNENITRVVDWNKVDEVILDMNKEEMYA